MKRKVLWFKIVISPKKHKEKSEGVVRKTFYRFFTDYPFVAIFGGIRRKRPQLYRSANIQLANITMQLDTNICFETAIQITVGWPKLRAWPKLRVRTGVEVRVDRREHFDME